EKCESHRRQDSEQADSQGDALVPDALKKWPNRDIDCKSPHHVIEPPWRLVRLQGVVTSHATLLTRERRIDGAEHELVIDRQESGYRFWIWSRSEGLDRIRHGLVGRCGYDLASRTAHPTQAKIGV